MKNGTNEVMKNEMEQENKYLEIFTSYEVEKPKKVICYGKFLEVIFEERKKIPKLRFDVMNETLDNAIERLTSSEQLVVALKYGLNDGHTESLDFISDDLQVTKEKVSQIEAEAIRKLKAFLKTSF